MPVVTICATFGPPWPWLWFIIPSCITQRPLSKDQISLKLEKLSWMDRWSTDGYMDRCTDGRWDQLYRLRAVNLISHLQAELALLLRQEEGKMACKNPASGIWSNAATNRLELTQKWGQFGKIPKVKHQLSPQRCDNSVASNQPTYLTMSSYSLSLPFESRHFRNEMDASTLAGEYVFGSFNSEIILSRIVLKQEQNKQHINSKCTSFT